MNNLANFSKKQLLEKIKQLEEDFKITFSALNSQLDTFFVFNPNTEKAIHWNETFCRISGYSNEEIEKFKAPGSFYSKGDVEKLHTFLKKITQSGTGVIELTLLCKNGKKIPTEYSVSRLKDFKGHPYLIILIGRDISKRKLYQQKLEFKEKQLNKAEELGNMGYWVLNLQEGFFTFSKGMYKITGTEKKNFDHSRESFFNMIHPDDRYLILKLRDIIKRGEEQSFKLQYRFIRPDGVIRYFDLRAQLSFDENEKPKELFGAIMDVTELLRNEKLLKEQNKEFQSLNLEYISQNEMLKDKISQIQKINQQLEEAKKDIEQSEERFRILYNNTPVMLQSVDMNGRLVSVNNHWLNTMGYSYDEVIGTKVTKFLTSDSVKYYQTLLPKLVQTGNLSNIEIQCITKDKKKLDILVSSKILYDEQKQPVITMTNLIDITEKKETERKQKKLNQELKIAKEKAEESDRLKSAFLANMSHEIRTPMNGIMGFAEMLKESGLKDKQREKYLSLIEKSGERMLNTINDLIDISKIESGQVKVNISTTNLNDMFRHIYDFFHTEAERKSVQLINDFEKEKNTVVIKTDRNKLYAVITNLLKNAIKFTNKGQINYGCKKEGDNLKFYVRDTGIGIANEKLYIIFDRFVQAENILNSQYQGSGLGLPISKAFIEIMGGKVWVESEENKGSAFYFTLPTEHMIKK